MEYVQKIKNLLSPGVPSSGKRKASYDLERVHKRWVTKANDHTGSVHACCPRAGIGNAHAAGEQCDGDCLAKDVRFESSVFDQSTILACSKPVFMETTGWEEWDRNPTADMGKAQQYPEKASELMDIVGGSEAKVGFEGIAEVQENLDDVIDGDKHGEEVREARLGKSRVVNGDGCVERRGEGGEKQVSRLRSSDDRDMELGSGGIPQQEPKTTQGLSKPTTTHPRNPPDVPPPGTTLKEPDHSSAAAKSSTQESPAVQEPLASEQWHHTPNRLAHCLVKRANPSNPLVLQQTLQASVQEPEYALRDIEMRDALWALMTRVEKFAETYFAFALPLSSTSAPTGCTPVPADQVALLTQTVYAHLQPATVKIVACVASGGPKGADGWHELFLDGTKRQALACAVVGNVLVEQVFGSLFFGGEKGEIEEVKGMQEEMRDKDGFDRNTRHAETIRKTLTQQGTPTNINKDIFLPTNFTSHVHHIVLSLWTHLSPLFALDPTQTWLKAPTHPLHNLITIVTEAGLLSLHMRLDPHTVYYFEPMFKEDFFTRARMECFNEDEMQLQHPRTPDDSSLLPEEEKRRRKELSETEKRRRKNDDALTRITIMHGVTAYRLGGWETAESKAEKRVFEEGCEGKGVRARVLTHGWVYCRWGKARRFEKGKEVDDGVEVHGEGYKGFVDFRDVQGVSGLKFDDTAVRDVEQSEGQNTVTKVKEKHSSCKKNNNNNKKKKKIRSK